MAESMQGVVPIPATSSTIEVDGVMQPTPVNPASVPNAQTLPTATSVPPPAEIVSETLYIQNLNERIKLNSKPGSTLVNQLYL